MKHIYVMAVILLLLFTPNPLFAFGYDLKDGQPYHEGEKVCWNMSSSQEAQLCLAEYAYDAKGDLENTIKTIISSGVLGSGEQSTDEFELMNKAWNKNMENFCYDYITKLYFPGSIYRSKSERCVFLMTKQRNRLFRALFLNENDHFNFLIRSGRMCTENDEGRDCLVRNVDYSREIFDFTTDGIVDDVEKSVDEKVGDLRKGTEKEIAILRKNIYETWLSNMNTLCHNYIKSIYSDNFISEMKSLQCELISYEGRSRLIHTLFYRGYRDRVFPEKPQKH